MATIEKRPNGRKVIRYLDGLKRPKISIGKASMADAISAKTHIEKLIASRVSGGGIPPATAQWLADIPAALAARLAGLGLCEPRRAPESLSVAGFLADYFSRRTDVKRGTKTRWKQTRRNLCDYFGENTALTAITEGKAHDFRRWLLTHEGLANATTVKRVKDAKQFFEDALRHELITKNPFRSLKAADQSNSERSHFVPTDVAHAVLDACPDAQWRLIFALSRWGGLRCPSEHLALTWGDVNWERGRLRVPCVKTAGHEGKAERIIPLFDEIRRPLEEAFDAAEAGATFVVTRYRDTNANLRTQFLRIIRRAGVRPWPRLFNSLRASRSTELISQFPAHVATAWLGHSEKVARKHYWQVTDADYEAALNEGKTWGAELGAVEGNLGPESGVATNGEKLQSNASEAGEPSKTPGNTPIFKDTQLISSGCKPPRVTPTGLEPVLPA